MVVGDKPPTISDVTLVKAPPSVRQEIYRQMLQEKLRDERIGAPLYEKATQLRVISEQLRGQAQELAVKAYEIKTRPPHPSLAQTILEYESPFRMDLTPSYFLKPQYHEKQVLAGIVAYPESIGHAIMSWVGMTPPTLPPPSPYVMTKETGPAYTFGYFLGMALTSYGIGKAVEASPLGKPIGKLEAWAWKKMVGTRAQTWLTKQYLEKGVAGWKGWKESLIMKVTGAKPYLARAEVGLAQLGPSGVSLKDLYATQAYWEMISVPRTTGVMIAKYPAVTKDLQTYTFEWTFAAGQLVPRYRPMRAEEFVKPPPTEKFKTLDLRRTYFEKTPWTMGAETPTYFVKPKFPTISELKERGLLPFVTQTQLTRMGVHPYIPYAPPFGISGPTVTPQILPLLFGFGVAAGAKETPSTYPAFELEPTPIAEPKLEGIVKPELFEPQMPAIFEVPVLEQPQKQKAALFAGLSQVAIQKQIQKTIQRQIQYQPPYPTPPRMYVPPKYPKMFELPKRRKRKGKEDLFGLYGRYKRFYPVMSAKEVMSLNKLPSEKKLKKFLGL